MSYELLQLSISEEEQKISTGGDKDQAQKLLTSKKSPRNKGGSPKSPRKNEPDSPRRAQSKAMFTAANAFM